MQREAEVDQQIVVDGEAAKLASELAALMHESVETAVMQAVRERLERERKVREDVEAIKEVLAKVPARDHSWLYGEDGLPA